jgi:hypothetical protein
MKTRESRSGIDRRQADFGPPDQLPECRRVPERRLPEVSRSQVASHFLRKARHGHRYLPTRTSLR